MTWGGPPTQRHGALIEQARLLLGTLQQEHEALLRRDVDALERIMPQKQQHATALAALERQSTVSGDERGAWVEVIEACRRQNTLNGALIAAQRRHAEQALALLSGQPQNAPLYDASGASAGVAAQNFLGRV